MTLPKTFVEGYHNEEAVRKMPYKAALGSTDMQVSLVSMGGAPLGAMYGGSTDVDTYRDVVDGALRAGMNYIDTAPWYGDGKGEEVLGKLLSGVPRSAYYIATKVGRYEPVLERMFDFRAERVIRSVDESLARLGLDYVDIIQVHDVEFCPDPKIIVNETLPALQKVVQSGKARYIGITGYALDALRTVLDTSDVRIDTVLSYCRLLPSDNGLVEFGRDVEARGVGLINAAPLGMGLFTQPGPQAWHPAAQGLKDACREAADYCTQQGVNLGKLALAHALAYPGASTHIVGMATAGELRANLASATEPLTAHEQACLDEVVAKFAARGSQHWEGVETDKYFANMGGRERILRDVYGRAPVGPAPALLELPPNP